MTLAETADERASAETRLATATARHTAAAREPAGMALGGAAKKLQKVADMGEELYARMNELREQIQEMRATVQDTHRRVEQLENKVDQQSAILEAFAEQEGIDVDAILTEVAIEEAEPAITEADDGDGPADGAGDAGTDADAASGESTGSAGTDSTGSDGAIDEARGDDSTGSD